MRVGFPLMMPDDTILADNFHGCDWLASFDLKTKEYTTYSITEVSNKSEKTDLISVLSELNIQQLVCNKMQAMALKYFNDQNITVYKALSNELKLNVELLLDGQLGRFLPQMAEVSSCGSSCSSCSSDSCK
ncbi:MAG: hypothetical protein PF541_11275 [Prolixibacteraceae bacterium]|jgi:predicted Fe-Mo cluster-binding NifX family protein|nr:hypothetical protein [Prolixibacteraceae bacterium]